MGRTLDQVIAELPSERRERVEARYQELKHEVEGLRELREITGKAQLEIAAALNIKQPSVSKIEKQTDMSFRLCATTSRRSAENLNWWLKCALATSNPIAPTWRRFGRDGSRHW